MPRNGNKTHCKRGHEFSTANTYVNPGGGRTCRRCHAMRCRDRRLGFRQSIGMPDDERPSLDPKAIRRLRDAVADGVALDDLSARFGVDRRTIRAYLQEASP